MKKAPIGFIPPILLGIFFTLSLYSRNINLIPADDLWLPLLLSIVLGLLLFGLFFLIFHSPEKAGILSFLLMGAIFSYGYSVYISGILAAGAVVVLSWPALRKYLNRRAVLVVSVVLLGLVIVPISGIVMHYLGSVTVASRPSPVTQQAGLPDIYYIIFDSYAGEKSLKEIGLITATSIYPLKRKVFIAGDSYCNYPGPISRGFFSEHGLP
jgi:hypothetical protein